MSKTLKYNIINIKHKIVSLKVAQELSKLMCEKKISPPEQYYLYHRYVDNDMATNWELHLMEPYKTVTFLNKVEIVPTYDVEDILKLLPTHILTDKGYYFREIKSNQVGYYQRNYAVDFPQLDSVFGYDYEKKNKKLSDALALLYMWLVDNTVVRDEYQYAYIRYYGEK